MPLILGLVVGDVLRMGDARRPVSVAVGAIAVQVVAAVAFRSYVNRLVTS